MNKGHTESETNIVNKFNEYKEFIKDKHIEFVIKKTERIIYGVYLLTNFIPDTELLHRDIKKTSHNLLAVVTQFGTSTGITPQVITSVHGHLQHLSTLFSLSFISGYISQSNIELMKAEINYLHKHIEELSTRSISETQHVELKQDLFVVGQSKIVRPKNTHLEVIKDTKIPESPKMSLNKKPQTQQTKSTTHSIDDSKEDREERVLQVIKDKRVVSIKDISSIIFDCSEKTIQRTLQLLIDKGQIKKEGERRWAKYQLV